MNFPFEKGIRCSNYNAKTLSKVKKLSEVDPSSSSLYIFDQDYESLARLPLKMPELEFFYSKNTPLTSLKGFPINSSKLQIISIENSRLSSLEGLPSDLPILRTLECKIGQISSLIPHSLDLPKISDIIFSENALTSLHGLPLVIHHHVSIDIRNNLFENLSGLPYIHNRADSSFVKFVEGEDLYNDFPEIFEEFDPFHDTFYSPRILLAGNPLRSLHGVPRLGFYKFVHRFHPSGYILHRHNEWPSTPEGVVVRTYEYGASKEKPPHFLLTRAGAALLDACTRENVVFHNYLADIMGGHKADHFFDNYDDFIPDFTTRSWHQAHNALFDFYRLSPTELTQQYLSHLSAETIMPEEALERLKHEGGIVERHILENSLPSPQNDMVLQTIQNRLSIPLDNGQRLLL